MKGKKRDLNTVEDMPADVSARGGWKPARHVIEQATVRLPTKRVTINLDQDIIAIFKAEAYHGGPPYQVAINQALRAFLRQRERSESELAAETVLKALDTAAVVRKLRRVLEPSAA